MSTLRTAVRRILVIPARRRSSRLPDKMLLRAAGKTVLQHTYEAALKVKRAELILIATGSEVGIAMQAAAALGDGVRVVSMPSTCVFDRQEAAYRESVLPKACRRRVAIEAGVSDFWRKYVGLDGDVVGIDTFGASAPIEALMPHFGFTVEHVVAVAKALG